MSASNPYAGRFPVWLTGSIAVVALFAAAAFIWFGWNLRRKAKEDFVFHTEQPQQEACSTEVVHILDVTATEL